MIPRSESVALMNAVGPTIERLAAEHRERREHWYFHEFIPWEQGRNYLKEPWDVSQCSLSPEVRSALLLNLLTEDNLPYYYARLAQTYEQTEAMSQWSGIWTAEEGQHAIAMRAYLLTSRNVDPRVLEDDRMTVVERGWDNSVEDPLDLFVYTSMQELATRLSHFNAGQMADDETAYTLMKRIAADENHHYMFYRGVVTEMLEHMPSEVLCSMAKVSAGFKMPGSTMPGWIRRSLQVAKAGIYNHRVHAEKVLIPLLREWKVDKLTGLTAEAAQAQEYMLALPQQYIAEAEHFEARIAAKKNQRATASA